jgi:hypothetical protein
MVVLTDLPPPSEGVEFVGRNTEAMISKNSVGKGTLYVAERYASTSDLFTLFRVSLDLQEVSVFQIMFTINCATFCTSNVILFWCSNYYFELLQAAAMFESELMD